MVLIIANFFSDSDSDSYSKTVTSRTLANYLTKLTCYKFWSVAI